MTSQRHEFDLKSNFHILFKSYRDKQLMQQHATVKNLSNYEDVKKEASEYEQKPIKNFDNFNDEEENEIKKKQKNDYTIDELKQKKIKLKNAKKK